MTCDELLQILNDYVDGTLDLSRWECQQFAAHLQGCQPCQIVVDTIRGTIQLYRAGEPYPLPCEFAERLQRLLRQRWKARFPSAAV